MNILLTLIFALPFVACMFWAREGNQKLAFGAMILVTGIYFQHIIS